MKKLIVGSILLLSLGGSILSVTEVSAQEWDNGSIIQPYAAIKKWKYKYENGHYYKRLYNYSTGKWEGGWIKVS